MQIRELKRRGVAGVQATHNEISMLDMNKKTKYNLIIDTLDKT